MQASLTKTNSATTTAATSSSVDKQMAENLAQDMSDLMHDFDVVSRINSMVSIHPSKHSSTHPSIQVGSLRCTYPGLTSDCMASIMDQIQRSIRQKDDEMSWLDKSCLQLAVRRKDKTETLTFQVGASMVVGKESFDVDVADALPGCEAGLGGRTEIGKTSS